jgi:hypothetical protein
MEKVFQKRIEKISQAIYLVSNHIKDNEPLKWELRKESIGFLSCIRSMNENDDGNDLPPDLVVDALSTYARDLISLLNLAIVAGLISKNNGGIIMEEIQSLLTTFQESLTPDIPRPGSVLSHDFFAMDPELQQHLNAGFNKGQLNFLSDKAAEMFNDKIPFPKAEPAPKALVAKNKPENNEEMVKDKKDLRQGRILTLLRAQSHLSIKDFAAVIPDCSEKTIQRELSELVEKGVIVKEGERRWSTYSLKQG